MIRVQEENGSVLKLLLGKVEEVIDEGWKVSKNLLWEIAKKFDDTVICGDVENRK